MQTHATHEFALLLCFEKVLGDCNIFFQDFLYLVRFDASEARVNITFILPMTIINHK